jgi:hypothetical protein
MSNKKAILFNIEQELVVYKCNQKRSVNDRDAERTFLLQK